MSLELDPNLIIGGYGPKESSHGLGLATFREFVESESGGQLQVEVIWNIMDRDRPNTDLIDMVSSGDLFMCYFSTSYLGQRVPELNLIDTPFLFEDLDQAHRCLDGLLGDRLRKAVRSRTEFELLGCWDNGFRHLSNRLEPVRTPADLAGMSVRIQPNEIHEALIRAWGATPVPVGLKLGIEMITSLEVDAQENPLANSLAYGVEKVHRHWTMTAHLYGARGLFANRRAYESLSIELRSIIDAAADQAIAAQRNAARQEEGRLRSGLESSGHQFVDLTEDEVGLFRDAGKPAVDLARRSLPGELFELVKQ